jgi:hypothetical protein
MNLTTHFLRVPRIIMSGAVPHTNRMPETSIVKKMYKWKPFTRRPVGRPKSRWEDDVRNDLRKMKLLNWAEQVQDRLKWKGIVEEAKTLPEF